MIFYNTEKPDASVYIAGILMAIILLGKILGFLG
jgi:hypothetical protein